MNETVTAVIPIGKATECCIGPVQFPACVLTCEVCCWPVVQSLPASVTFRTATAGLRVGHAELSSEPGGWAGVVVIDGFRWHAWLKPARGAMALTMQPAAP